MEGEEDAKEISHGKGFVWKDWSVARGRDCVYIWSDAVALELSNGSNGWFRFIIDGKLTTMYSSGSPEGGPDATENRGEFLEKLQRAKASVKVNTPHKLFSKPAEDFSIEVGNWCLCSKKEGELHIINSEGMQQATILREDYPGFLFESTGEQSIGSSQRPFWAQSSPPVGPGRRPRSYVAKRKP
ncbi:Hect E3 ubiquitin ligase [Caligus rogercresseyi]|uniref:Hect E3 ubiquitin ligase n=1 Tax=Caligus rogercresseyi TaxID=217165 RepID=A0A7T8HIT2_CALRO|nr:Hect E3 ubiquitin ligase [Caligus rogercresseyi]